jgi:hypothetical protein
MCCEIVEQDVMHACAVEQQRRRSESSLEVAELEPYEPAAASGAQAGDALAEAARPRLIAKTQPVEGANAIWFDRQSCPDRPELWGLLVYRDVPSIRQQRAGRRPSRRCQPRPRWLSVP